MRPGHAFSLWRVGVVLAMPVALIAAAVFLTANVQRSAALLGARQQEAALNLRGAMFDQEDGAHGLFLSQDRRYLQLWSQGTSEFASSLAELRSLLPAHSALRQSLVDQARLADTWHDATGKAILDLERTGHAQSHDAIEDSREQMDAFRAANATFDASLSKANAHRLAVATDDAVAVVAALAALLVGAGLLMARRLARREAARQRDQAKLRELLQVSESEQEARKFLIGHLQMLAPAADAAVLSRSGDDDRLEITTSRSDDPLAVRAGVEHLRPRSCMAVRLGRAYDRSPGDNRLLRCEICGASDGASVCEPLVVGGQTIGSVLVASDKVISVELRDQIRETVAQAAPILANQRNLARAETLARSDSLTGLSNRRAADETLDRLIAQAARSSTPLAVVMLDLDGLKQLNDRYGHAAGDDALALLGRIISSAIRASDFGARIGGDEFVIMLPDTDREGAIAIADTLRRAIKDAKIEGIGSISASLGVAMMPADATDADDLLSKADRALYTAKEQGRNCIGVYASSPDEQHNRRIGAGAESGRRFQRAESRSADDLRDREGLRVIASD